MHRARQSKWQKTVPVQTTREAFHLLQYPICKNTRNGMNECLYVILPLHNINHRKEKGNENIATCTNVSVA